MPTEPVAVDLAPVSSSTTAASSASIHPNSEELAELEAAMLADDTVAEAAWLEDRELGKMDIEQQEAKIKEVEIASLDTPCKDKER